MAAFKFGCAGGCGAVWEGEDPTQCPWHVLEITNRVRCWDCQHELEAASQLKGTPSVSLPDPLGKHDLGALKRLPEAPELKEQVR